MTTTSPTSRPSSTPASPSTWSAWKWVSTSSGTRSHVEPVQAPVDQRGVGPGVHDDGRVPGPSVEDQRVALADVAGHQHPPARRPPEVAGPDQDRDDQHQAAAEAGDRPAQQPGRRQRETGHERGEHGQRQRAGPPADGRGGERRTALGDLDDPGDAHRGERAGRPAGEPGQQAEQPAGEAQHRRGPHRGRHEHVGRDRDEAHLARDRGDDRRARQLRGQRHRDRLGEPAGQPPGQGVAHPGSQHQDPGGGQHGQHEAGRHGQARVDQHQDQHGDAERPQAALAPVVRRGR